MDNNIPVVSKIFCSGTPTILMIRRRPIVVNGGGFIVTDLGHNVAFIVDGCGVLGSKRELMVKDSEGEPILFISRKGGIVQALSTRNKWNGYSMDYQGKDKLAFSLTDPKSCIATSTPMRIHIEPKRHCTNWDFEIGGSFVDRDCRIIDCTGKTVAQKIFSAVTKLISHANMFMEANYENTDMVMINKSHFMKAQKTKSIYSPIALSVDRNVQTFPDIFLAFMIGRKDLIGGKDFYHVEVQSGYDQAFIIGVMAILDNINRESTRC